MEGDEAGYLNWGLEDSSLDAGHSLDEARKIVKENLSARQNVIVGLLIGLIRRTNFCKLCSTPPRASRETLECNQDDRHVLRSQFVACSSDGKATSLPPITVLFILNIARVLSWTRGVAKHHQPMPIIY